MVYALTTKPNKRYVIDTVKNTHFELPIPCIQVTVYLKFQGSTITRKYFKQVSSISI